MGGAPPAMGGSPPAMGGAPPAMGGCTYSEIQLEHLMENWVVNGAQGGAETDPEVLELEDFNANYLDY